MEKYFEFQSSRNVAQTAEGMVDGIQTKEKKMVRVPDTIFIQPWEPDREDKIFDTWSDENLDAHAKKYDLAWRGAPSAEENEILFGGFEQKNKKIMSGEKRNSFDTLRVKVPCRWRM